MKDFMLGTMYWLNPNYTLDDIRSDMRAIRDNNFNIIRSFACWETIESKEGQYDFTQTDMLFKAASEYDIKIMETFGTYLPVWLRKKLAQQGISDNNRRYPCFDRPEVREPLEKFIELTVNRYKGSPVLHIWNLWNEPNKNACACPATLQRFIEWLKKRYPGIEELKKAWLGEFHMFASMCPESYDELTVKWLSDAFEHAPGCRITSMQYDWLDFSTDSLNDNMAWLRNLVKKIDPVHETHANPDTPCINGLDRGVNEWQMSRILDSISVSVHPSHQFFAFEKIDKFPVTSAFCIDQVYSWASGKDAWIGELQAGVTYYHSNHYSPSPEFISQTLYRSLARNLKGVLFWEWQCWRASMFEVGEFSLRRTYDGAPTERSKAAAEFGRVVKENSAFISKLCRQKARVAIFHSVRESIFKVQQGYNKSSLWSILLDHKKAQYGCYKALDSANIQVDFVTELQIQEGILDDYKVLFMPHVELMSSETASHISTFVKNGGALWADGRCAFLDEHIFLRNMIPGHGLDVVFGCREADFISPDSEFDRLTMMDGGNVQAYRHIQYLEPCGGEVIGSYKGHPVAILNSYGKGTAVIFGSYVTLGIQAHEDTDAMEQIVSFAIKNGAAPVLDVLPARGIQVAMMKNDNKAMIVVTNLSGAENDVMIKSPVVCNTVVCPQDTDVKCSIDNGVISRRMKNFETISIFCK